MADDGDVAFGGMVGIAVAAEPDEATGEELDEDAAPTTTETPTTTEAPAAAVDAAAATVTASSDGIVLAGTVPSEDIATSLRAAAADQYPEDQIDDQLEVVEGAEPFTLTVSGTLDDAVVVDGLTASFDALGLGTGLSNELALSEGGAAVAELNDLFALEPIQFETGTATIVADSLPTLAAATEILLANPDLAVEVGGHTDSRGNDEGNLALSQLRADAVVAALQDGGVTNDLTAVGYGETDLKEDPDDTAEKQQANRRIEFKLL